MNPAEILSGYNLQNLTIGCLGGHSALDVCHGAKKHGFKTLVVAQKGRENVYKKYFRSRNVARMSSSARVDEDIDATTQGCVDETLVLIKFQDVLNEDTQKDLRNRNTIFIPSRYCWVYFKDFAKFENDFDVPVFGNRSYVKFEERDQNPNQYDLLKTAGIRTPKIFKSPKEIDRLCIVKASEAKRGYERGFFLVKSWMDWDTEGSSRERKKMIDSSWKNAPIEEFIVGAPVNFNFFYSPLTKTLELMGTDTRRQTNLDGFLRLIHTDQDKASHTIPLKMVETGHIAVTVKESLLEKAFDLGERFVKATKSLLDKEIIGPFALQGAVVAEEGKEDIVIFDVSLRIPGSPGIRFTPYSGYLHGEPMSYGERIGMEIRNAVEGDRLEAVVT